MTANVVFVVDDDAGVLDSLRALLEADGLQVETFDNAKTFLSSPASQRSGCLIADIRMPEMDGLELQQELAKRGAQLAIIIITGHGDVPLAVRAMKAGAADFIEKPFDDEALLASVRHALVMRERTHQAGTLVNAAKERLAGLSPRERQVLDRLIAGKQNKTIALELEISPRTVEIHRAHLMNKMRAGSLSELVRLALAAGVSPSG